MSFSYKVQRELNEKNSSIRYHNENLIGLRSQLIQRSLNFTKESESTNYLGWVTTEAALKSNSLSKSFHNTTLDKLATCRYRSSQEGANRVKNSGGVLATQTSEPIVQPQLQNLSHQSKRLGQDCDLKNKISKRMLESFKNSEAQNKKLQVKVDELNTFKNTSEDFTSRSVLIDDQNRHTKNLGDKQVGKESIVLPLTQSASVSNFTDYKSSELEAQVDHVIKSPSLNKVKMDDSDEFLWDSESSLEYNISGVKYDIQMSQQASLVSGATEIIDFDQGIDDMDFLAVSSCTSLLGDDNISSQEINAFVDANPSLTSSSLSPVFVDDITTKNLSPPVLKNLAEDYSEDSMDEEICGLPFLKQKNSFENLKTVSNLLKTSDRQISLENANKCSARYSPSNVNSTVNFDEKIDQTGSKILNSHISTPKIPRAELPNLGEKIKSFISVRNAEKSDAKIVSHEDTELNSNKRKSLASEKVHTRYDYLLYQKNTFNGRKSPLNSFLDDSDEFNNPGPFARPDFPVLASKNSPIIGLSSDFFLRVCFRIGELFKEARRFSTLTQTPVIELFARVKYSYREPGTSRQTFQFSDMWHDRPPFPDGLLVNYQATDLMNEESEEFNENEQKLLARVLGTVRKDAKQTNGWFLYIMNIRKTDWEEINWTRKIVSSK